MKRVRDVVRQGSDPQIRGNLGTIASRLARCAERLPVDPVDDHVGIVATHLLRYISRELRAAAPQFKKDIFAFAWRTRNIFEGMLLLIHATSSVELSAQFVAQKIGDEKTIIDDLLSVGDPPAAEQHPLRARSAKASRVLAKYGFERASPWRMDLVARSVRMEIEYAGFYKLYSKYVHPSAWSVLSDPDEYGAIEYWEIFLVQAQLHALHALSVGDTLVASRQTASGPTQLHPQL